MYSLFALSIIWKRKIKTLLSAIFPTFTTEEEEEKAKVRYKAHFPFKIALIRSKAHFPPFFSPQQQDHRHLGRNIKTETGNHWTLHTARRRPLLGGASRARSFRQPHATHQGLAAKAAAAAAFTTSCQRAESKWPPSCPPFLPCRDRLTPSSTLLRRPSGQGQKRRRMHRGTRAYLGLSAHSAATAGPRKKSQWWLAVAIKAVIWSWGQRAKRTQTSPKVISNYHIVLLCFYPPFLSLLCTFSLCTPMHAAVKLQPIMLPANFWQLWSCVELQQSACVYIRTRGHW